MDQIKSRVFDTEEHRKGSLHGDGWSRQEVLQSIQQIGKIWKHDKEFNTRGRFQHVGKAYTRG